MFDISCTCVTLCLLVYLSTSEGGGVYVGQWEANKKHGLGVVLDYSPDSDVAGMPTFRYEGGSFWSRAPLLRGTPYA